MGCIQVTPGVILNNVIPLKNFLLNSCFENPNIILHFFYILNMHVNFHVNRLLFTI